MELDYFVQFVNEKQQIVAIKMLNPEVPHIQSTALLHVLDNKVLYGNIKVFTIIRRYIGALK